MEIPSPWEGNWTPKNEVMDSLEDQTTSRAWVYRWTSLYGEHRWTLISVLRQKAGSNLFIIRWHLFLDSDFDVQVKQGQNFSEMQFPWQEWCHAKFYLYAYMNMHTNTCIHVEAKQKTVGCRQERYGVTEVVNLTYVVHLLWPGCSFHERREQCWTPQGPDSDLDLQGVTTMPKTQSLRMDTRLLSLAQP